MRNVYGHQASYEAGARGDALDIYGHNFADWALGHDDWTQNDRTQRKGTSGDPPPIWLSILTIVMVPFVFCLFFEFLLVIKFGYGLPKSLPFGFSPSTLLGLSVVGSCVAVLIFFYSFSYLLTALPIALVAGLGWGIAAFNLKANARLRIDPEHFISTLASDPYGHYLAIAGRLELGGNEWAIATCAVVFVEHMIFYLVMRELNPITDSWQNPRAFLYTVLLIAVIGGTASFLFSPK